MNPSAFEKAATGRLIPITSLTGESFAFVPKGVPPKWTWPNALWPLLVEARTALARLEGTGRHLPSPNLIQTPLLNREAFKSSSLEGTVTDPIQQALFQLDPVVADSPNDPANAFREVFNYSRALRIRKETQKDLPLSLRLVRMLHKTLMTGVRGADKNPGEFRKYQNQIGRPARYVPPPAEHIDELLDDFEESLHIEWGYDPLVKSLLVHYQFEAIHPFMDGNGRVGRMLLAICIAEWCGLEDQWLYMSAYFDAHKDEYLDRLLAVSTRGEWSGWIEFCLQGVITQAKDTQQRCDALLKLHKGLQLSVAKSRGSARHAAIVTELFSAPVVRVVGVQKSHGVTYPTARSDLQRLEELGIIKEIKKTAPITYYCPRIFTIAYGDNDGQP